MSFEPFADARLSRSMSPVTAEHAVFSKTASQLMERMSQSRRISETGKPRGWLAGWGGATPRGPWNLMPGTILSGPAGLREDPPFGPIASASWGVSPRFSWGWLWTIDEVTRVVSHHHGIGLIPRELLSDEAVTRMADFW